MDMQILSQNPSDQLLATIQCQICLEQQPLSQIKQFNGIKHDICLVCFENYLKNLITNRKIHDLKCPHCIVQLTEEQIQTSINDTLFQKYKNFQQEDNILLSKDMKYCPNVKCQHLFEFDKHQSGNCVTCPKCQSQICKNCRLFVHKGIPCNEALMQEIYKGFSGSSQSVKPCPSCLNLIEKNGGCKELVCTKCSFHWCWECSKQYTNFHYPFNCETWIKQQENGGQCSCKKCLELLLQIIFVIIIGILIFPFFGEIMIQQLTREDDGCKNWYKTLTKKKKVLFQVIMFPLSFLLSVLLGFVLIAVGCVYLYQILRLLCRRQAMFSIFKKQKPLNDQPQFTKLNQPNIQQEEAMVDIKQDKYINQM